MSNAAAVTAQEYCTRVGMRKPLSVAVNLLYLRPGNVGGSETYVRKLLDALAERIDCRIVLLLPSGVQRTFPGHEAVQIGSGPYDERTRILGENLLIVPSLLRIQADVLFSPANFGAPLLPIRIPQVVTVHDLQHHHFPDWFSPLRRAIRTAAFRATFLRARHVIAISQFTRDDVLKNYPIRPAKISVVYEGADPLEMSPVDADQAVIRHNLLEDYFIYPAMLTPHKNHRALLQAWALLRTRRVAPTLVFSGKETPYLRTILETAADCGVSASVRYLGYVSRGELLGLMSRARALLFPSCFEGFGLPVIEAMQLGTPVVVSTAGSLPEVSGGAALSVAPDDVDGWATAVARILDEPALRRDLVALGHRNVARFSWSRCADQTAKVLSDAVR